LSRAPKPLLKSNAYYYIENWSIINNAGAIEWMV